MGRVLSVAHVTVNPDRRDEYIGAMAELIAVFGGKGWHCWLFCHPNDPHRFLEFRERPAGTVNPSAGLERTLEERLRELAARDVDAGIAWEEVTWPAGPGLTGEQH